MTNNAEAQNARDLLDEFYDDFRTACMAKKYYAHRLTIFQRTAFAFELAIAISASGSFAALKPLSDVTVCQLALPYCAALVAVLAIIKPLLQLDKSIERYSKLVSGYTDLIQSAARLIRAIKRERALRSELCETIKQIQSNIDKLVSLDDHKPNREKLVKFQTEVIEEYPLEFFFWPSAHVIA
jgi:hypothetical protein